MTISRYVVTVSTLVVGLAMPPSTEAQFVRSEELVCSGRVTYGQETFPDQVILKVSQLDVEVSGQTGETSTFEGMLPYKICSESQNDLDFEYSTLGKCGSSSTRTGYLNKVLGNLHLFRSDRMQLLVGDYKCKPAQRVLK